MELKTANNRIIVVTGRAMQHLTAHPNIVELLPEAVSHVVAPEERVRFDAVVDLGRDLGPATLIATPPITTDDVTTFAHRPGRDAASRVVEVKFPPMARTVLVSAGPTSSIDRFELITAFLGLPAEPEPWARSAAQRKAALAFWCRSALIHDPKVMGPMFRSSWRSVLDQVDAGRGPRHR